MADKNLSITKTVALPASKAMRPDKHYCYYCGQEAVEDIEYYNHGREEDISYLCSCDGAHRAAELGKTIYETKAELNMLNEKPHESILRKQFKLEVAELKTKYSIK